MKKVCFILTAEFAVKAFLLNHLRVLGNHYALTVIVNTENIHFLQDLGINATVITLPISRKINPISDGLVLLKLWVILYRNQFDAVHTLMPKAGLLGAIAAKLAQVPIRIHMFTGQVWANRVGLTRYLLKKVDKLIASLTTVNLVDGHAQRQFLIDENVLKEEQSYVFLNGSIAGVDLHKFHPNAQVRSDLRLSLGIQRDATVFLYIGRLNREKGLLDLAKAFSLLPREQPHLVFVGPDEEGLKQEIATICHQVLNKLHFVDYTSQPEAYMAASDVLCLPSYREGFNNVVIEAAAVGIPAIASNIYGVTDAVSHQQTGLLHEVKNVPQIRAYMQTLIDEPDMRNKLGQQAREHTRTHYNAQDVTQAWLEFYKAILG